MKIKWEAAMHSSVKIFLEGRHYGYVAYCGKIHSWCTVLLHVRLTPWWSFSSTPNEERKQCDHSFHFSPTWIKNNHVAREVLCIAEMCNTSWSHSWTSSTWHNREHVWIQDINTSGTTVAVAGSQGVKGAGMGVGGKTK